jgi:hypothetical protein
LVKACGLHGAAKVFYFILFFFFIKKKLFSS